MPIWLRNSALLKQLAEVAQKRKTIVLRLSAIKLPVRTKLTQNTLGSLSSCVKSISRERRTRYETTPRVEIGKSPI